MADVEFPMPFGGLSRGSYMEMSLFELKVVLDYISAPEGHVLGCGHAHNFAVEMAHNGRGQQRPRVYGTDLLMGCITRILTAFRV